MQALLDLEREMGDGTQIISANRLAESVVPEFSFGEFQRRAVDKGLAGCPLKVIKQVPGNPYPTVFSCVIGVNGIKVEVAHVSGTRVLHAQRIIGVNGFWQGNWESTEDASVLVDDEGRLVNVDVELRRTVEMTTALAPFDARFIIDSLESRYLS